MGAPSKWMVSELFDPHGSVPRYVIAHRQGEAPWLRVWQHRHQVQSKLAAWMVSLCDDGLKPLVRPLVGRNVALDEDAAHAICRFRLSEINRMAGCADSWADFLLNDEPIRCGRRGRPCTVIEGDRVLAYPNITSAAAAEGVARKTVSRRVRQARLYHGGKAVVLPERRNRANRARAISQWVMGRGRTSRVQGEAGVCWHASPAKPCLFVASARKKCWGWWGR